MPLCISVEKKLAEKTIQELRRRRLLDDSYFITRGDENVVIPVRPEAPTEIDLSFVKLHVFDCSPPPRIKTKVDLPSLDVIGDVVILREKVLESKKPEEVISAIRRIYPRTRAIWVKEETVDVYRVPLLKLLWGEEIREIVIKEHGLRIKVKLGDVYFNPRLAEEHERVASLVKNGEVVVDAFSGVGGFALHIAARCTSLVVANDINPVAHELLIENIKLNRKILKGIVIPLNLDIRELTECVRESSADRIIADLPMWSDRYYEVYESLLKPGGILHLYKVFKDEEVADNTLSSLFKNWFLRGCKLVLEYAPRTGIYRCDLVKPFNV